MKSKLPIYLSAKDVAEALSVSISTAYRKLQTVKAAYDIPKYQKVLVTKFCKFYEIDLENFYFSLGYQPH